MAILKKDAARTIRATGKKWLMKRQMTRRSFLTRTTAGAAGGGFVILGNSSSARAYAANEKLNVALIGVGGRGSWFVETIPRIGENVVAMCDIWQHRHAVRRRAGVQPSFLPDRQPPGS